jgi:hypothetical protein
MTDPRLTRLHELLQKALEIELFTIPPYLTALYSIKEGTNRDSAKIIQSVVMEEMLHATLVANVMNAVGAIPLVSPERSRGRLKKCNYPSRIPHINLDLEVALSPFSEHAITDFKAIEAPESPKEWKDSIRLGQIHSIGHLYNIVLDHLVAVANELGEDVTFSGDPTRQVGPEQYYGAGGRVIRVHNLTDAKTVISEVAQQGEGRIHVSNLTGDELVFHQPDEVAHYYRFEQILAGRYYDRYDDLGLPSGPRLLVNWLEVYKIKPFPGSSSKGPSGLEELVKAFDQTYCELLNVVHRGFNGEPEALREATIIMQRLKQETISLMQVEIGNGETCGPPFWFATVGGCEMSDKSAENRE